jgi:hypothetical protein
VFEIDNQNLYRPSLKPAASFSTADDLFQQPGFGSLKMVLIKKEIGTFSLYMSAIFSRIFFLRSVLRKC